MVYRPFQQLHPKNRSGKLDGNAPRLIDTAGNELWATGEWSETGQGKNGEPIPVKNHWFCIYVREGDDWKILACAFGDSPASTMTAYQNFGPQPAATPSPTASPSTQ